jgi:hypothetical protein
MGQLTHEQYDIIERAVLNGTRVILRRKGRRENIVIPLSLKVVGSREVVEARNPTTGHALKVYLDELDSIELVK